MTNEGTPMDESPVAEPQIVQPQPMPVTTMVGSVDLPTGPAVVVRFASVNGESIYFLPRDAALEFAANVRAAAQTGPRLVAPPAGFQVPR